MPLKELISTQTQALHAKYARLASTLLLERLRARGAPLEQTITTSTHPRHVSPARACVMRPSYRVGRRADPIWRRKCSTFCVVFSQAATRAQVPGGTMPTTVATASTSNLFFSHRPRKRLRLQNCRNCPAAPEYFLSQPFQPHALSKMLRATRHRLHPVADLKTRRVSRSALLRAASRNPPSPIMLRTALRSRVAALRSARTGRTMPVSQLLAFLRLGVARLSARVLLCFTARCLCGAGPAVCPHDDRRHPLRLEPLHR